MGQKNVINLTSKVTKRNSVNSTNVDNDAVN